MAEIKQTTPRDLIIAKKVGFARLVKRGIQLYNNLCQPCRSLAAVQPKRPISDYCQECQQKIKDKLGDLADG